MAAVSVHRFAQCITCHVWSPDETMVAFCPNNNEVHIYKLLEEKWEKIHVLQKHDQIVSGIDWSKSSNRIVTVSRDRNSYVWSQEMTQWMPTIVILRLNRAGLCVHWSPKENKFAVGSGAKTVCICYYEQENNWWVSKVIRKRHESSVTSVAWHPNNTLLDTTSTDGKCRVFSTFIKGVDTRDSSGSSSDSKFGEDGEFLVKHGALPEERIRAVETGGCQHAAIREDININLGPLEELSNLHKADILLCKSGGETIPRKGGPGITQADLLVIKKTDTAAAVGADLSVMQRDALPMRDGGPFVFAQVKHGVGVQEIVGHI